MIRKITHIYVLGSWGKCAAHTLGGGTHIRLIIYICMWMNVYIS